MNSISHNIRMIKLVIMRNREAYPHVVTSKQDKNEFVGKTRSENEIEKVINTGETNRRMGRSKVFRGSRLCGHLVERTS